MMTEAALNRRNLTRLLAIFSLAVVAGFTFLDVQTTSTAQSDTEYLHFNACPAWSPDGTYIAFVSRRSGSLDIWIMESDGANPRNLTLNDPGSEFCPRWSPDGQFIAYLSVPEGERFYDFMSGEGSGNVAVMKQDGSNPINLTASFEGASGNYRWSPDGRYLAFINPIALIDDGEELPSSAIWLIEPDGSHSVNLTPDNSFLFDDLTWGPDSRKIAYTTVTKNPLARDGIRILDVDNPLPVIVTFGRNDGQVAWSPSGDTLAIVTFYSDGSGMYDIWRVDADGKNLTNLTPDHPELDRNPVWSPDGQWIAFESNQDIPDGLGRDIWVMAADGSAMVNLTANVGDWNIRPAWSPDGNRIAFESYGDDYELIGLSGHSDIWVMNADGSNPVNLTAAP